VVLERLSLQQEKIDMDMLNILNKIRDIKKQLFQFDIVKYRYTIILCLNMGKL